MLRVIVFLCGVLVILINGFLLLLPRPTLHLMMISEAGSMGIHALLPETGETIRVTTGRSQKKYFSWSPDKK